jgi:hypothetical protein
MMTATTNYHPAPKYRIPRSVIYRAIDREREFQNALAGAAHGDPTNDQKKGLEHFALYLNHYVLQLQTQLTTTWGPEAYEQPLHTLRKIAALAVAAQEIHGVRERLSTPEEVQKRMPLKGWTHAEAARRSPGLYLKTDALLPGGGVHAAGSRVFPGADAYGCASDDTRTTGIEHRAFSVNASGLPFFTHPAKDVEIVK